MKICASCQRYVKSQEDACPFCSSTDLRAEATTPNLGRGTSRARIYAARAVIAGAALSTTAACGDDNNEGDPTAQTGGQTSSGGSEASGGALASGGAMATGGEASDSGGASAEGGEGGEVSFPIYGGPFPDMMKARV